MQSQEHIKVWDPLVRVFHWSLVSAFALAYVSGDEWTGLHVVAGYTIAGLLLVRIAWGFIGTRYARFSNFVYRPATVKAYLKDVIAFRARRYVGHNPAGGAMVVALLLMLVATALTGMLSYGVEEEAGPFVSLVAGIEGDWLKGLHEFFANGTLALVALHIIGVMIASRQHGENLVAAMWNGYKRNNGGE